VKIPAFIVSAVFLELTVVQFSPAQGMNVQWGAFSQRYGENQSGNMLARFVVGQNFNGTARQSNTQIVSGFLGFTLSTSIVVAVDDEGDVPMTYSLEQNYPNPFNPTTVVCCQWPDWCGSLSTTFSGGRWLCW
jgi:hypothetical protein